MFVFAKDLKTLKEGNNGKWTCKDFFTVKSIQYVDRKICYVAIKNEKTGKLIEFGQPAEMEASKRDLVDSKQVQVLRNTIKSRGVGEDEILQQMGMPDWSSVTREQYNGIITILRSKG